MGMQLESELPLSFNESICLEISRVSIDPKGGKLFAPRG